MDENTGKLIQVSIEDEMRTSYLDYAMSVIVGRALPDVRDGLKPVHRRALFAMNEMGNHHNKPYKKSARIVGDVIGKYHPHGDQAVYDTIVRLAQDFSMRYPLVDGQGNFGSIDGDSAAAMRYTEIRLDKLSDEMLDDLDKDTVDFAPNYDDSMKEPTVLPCRFPNLLVNGSSGIAVGMTTNIPPHNIQEVCKGVEYLIDNPDCSVDDLIAIIPGPDFPTAGIIQGRAGILSAYRTGKGHLRVRAKCEFEQNKRKDQENIIITEFPYQVNKAKTLEKIAELVRDKRVTGISDIRDESDRNGIRVVIELRKDAIPSVVLNQLYKHTNLQDTFGVIMISLVNRQPKLLNLKEMLHYFVDHRRVVITRRTLFELAKARAREHILEGLRTAVDNLDEVVDLIKKSATPAEAQEGLKTRFKLSAEQAKAILELRLQRLTGLERQKIIDELESIKKEIKELEYIRDHEEKKFAMIKEEMALISQKFGDKRRTEIVEAEEELDEEDLIADEDMVVTLTQDGYIKRVPIGTYRAQRRGGKGVKSMSVKDEDVVVRVFIASTHSYLLIFTSSGKVFRIKVWEIPLASRAARGKSLANLLEVEPNEKVAAVFSIKDFEETERYLLLATRAGTVKKTELKAYANIHKRGIYAIKLSEGDQLAGAELTDGNCTVFLATAHGKAIHFHEKDARSMGRHTGGVRGINLNEGDEVVGLALPGPDSTVLSVTENGYGKRTKISEYRVIGRGGKGMINIISSERNGQVVSVKVVDDDAEIMLVTEDGQMIRTRVSEISVIGRNTQGVKILDTEGKHVISVAVLEEDKEEKEDKEK
ncbi:MAG: DNA gyrase subunit A [Nitrospinota bacterium]|nr:DNA gyrase subunit A [Nitrospinota bacterium]